MNYFMVWMLWMHFATYYIVLKLYRFSKMYSTNTDHSFENVVVKKWSYKSESLIQFIVKKRQKRKSLAYTAIDSYYVNELLKCAAVVAVQYPRK